MSALYGHSWAVLSRAKRARDPLCEACLRAGILKPATLVDHTTPVKAGGAILAPMDQLRSLCIACHNVKTARIDQGHSVPRHVQGFDANGDPLCDGDPWHGTPHNAPDTAPTPAPMIREGGSKDCVFSASTPAAHSSVCKFSACGEISDSESDA